MLHDFFTFNGKGSSHTTQVAESKDKNWEKDVLPAVSEGQVRGQQKDLKVHKSSGPGKVSRH